MRLLLPRSVLARAPVLVLALHGEQEFELLKPIFVGDVLTWTCRIADIYEKEGGRGGKMKFAVVESHYINQRGQNVAIARNVMIEFPSRPQVA